jgi:O-antigen/teichoic acid export membrane protein
MLGQNLNATLHGLGKFKIPVIALSIGVVVKTIFNMVFVPMESIGIYGAIASSIICYAIVVGIELHDLKKSIKSSSAIIELSSKIKSISSINNHLITTTPPCYIIH